jgi:hypothetical protein
MNKIQPTTLDKTAREDPKFAEKVLKKVFPGKSDRDLVLTQFLDSFLYAESLAPNAVAVTLQRNGFRLNVGRVEVLTAFDGEIMLLLHNPSERIRAELQTSIESAPYKSVSGDNWFFWGNPRKFKAYRDDLVAAHHQFIKEAGTTLSGTPVKGSKHRASHSPGLVAFAKSLAQSLQSGAAT